MIGITHGCQRISRDLIGNLPDFPANQHKGRKGHDALRPKARPVREAALSA